MIGDISNALKKASAFLGALLAIGALGIYGCGKSAQNDDYLIRVGDHMITVSEFEHAVDTAAEEALLSDQALNPAAENDLRMRVLNQLTEELIIARRAGELGMTVSDDELNKAIEEIKADYPDDTFEQTLLENAISFSNWKKELAARLLMNKVIEDELVAKVEISAQDVADYFQVHYPEGVPEGENSDEINQRIVRHLRHQKAEILYSDWIENLRHAYPVEIHKQRWNQLAEKE